MKKLLFLLFGISALLAGQAQQNRYKPMVAYCDPAVSQLSITDIAGRTVNTDKLEIGTPVRLRFTIGNNDALASVPAGNLELMISLGSKFLLQTDLQGGNVPLSNYFQWELAQAPGAAQYILHGKLIRDLPTIFSGTVDFELMPYRAGSSTLICQLMIPNLESEKVVLSDNQPANNYISSAYTNVKPLGIKFTQAAGQAHGCALELNWAVFDENKLVKRFVIETSDDGISFRTQKTVMATAAVSYTTLLEGFNKTSLQLRVKAETASGEFVYSPQVSVVNLCSGRFELGLFPNPLPKEITELNITAKAGIFNGKYNFKLTDVAGKEIKVSELTFANQVQVKFNTGFITGGTYFLNITGEDGSVQALKFVKQ